MHGNGLSHLYCRLAGRLDKNQFTHHCYEFLVNFKRQCPAPFNLHLITEAKIHSLALVLRIKRSDLTHGTFFLPVFVRHVRPQHFITPFRRFQRMTVQLGVAILQNSGHRNHHRHCCSLLVLLFRINVVSSRGLFLSPCGVSIGMHTRPSALFLSAAGS